MFECSARRGDALLGQPIVPRVASDRLTRKHEARVLVSYTSKGRKGTSWNHIANVMADVDSHWRQDRVTYGLSSGEGLIWAVRDPIEETKPVREKGRHTGEYETFIANHGEPDKRLFVIEAEFANVLKSYGKRGEHPFASYSFSLGLR